MTAVRILNLFALTALATLLTTLAPQPVQALEHRGLQFGRRHQHAHIAENALIKKRSNSKKCRARPTSSSSASPTATPSPTSTHKDNSPPQPTTTKDSKPAPKPTQPAQPPSSGGGLFSKKIGLAWADGDSDYLLQFKGQVGWMYNWGAGKPSNADKAGIPYLPQAWGWKDGAAFLSAAKSSNAPLFPTINEPNEGGQANMDPGSGVAFWKQYVKPIRDMGKKVTSPATSSNPNGLTWVKNFKSQCGECDWDYTAIHWYDVTFDKFKTYCETWHDAFGKDIIITEFALQNFNGGDQPSLGDVYSFFSQAIPYLESTPWIVGYAPFGFIEPPTGIQPNMNLVNGGGSLTGLGSFILGKA